MAQFLLSLDDPSPLATVGPVAIRRSRLESAGASGMIQPPPANEAVTDVGDAHMPLVTSAVHRQVTSAGHATAVPQQAPLQPDDSLEISSLEEQYGVVRYLPDASSTSRFYVDPDEPPRPGVARVSEQVEQRHMTPHHDGDDPIFVNPYIKDKVSWQKEWNCYVRIGSHPNICRARLRRLAPGIELERGECDLYHLMQARPDWVRDHIKFIAWQCFEGMLHCHRCGLSIVDFKSPNVVCFADRVNEWIMKVVDLEHSEDLTARLGETHFTTTAHVPTHRPATPMAFDLWAFRTLLLQLVTLERFNDLWCNSPHLFGTQASPKDPVQVLLDRYGVSMKELIPHDVVLQGILGPKPTGIRTDEQAAELRSKISDWLWLGD